MAKLTKKQFEEMFREEVLPYVADQYERDGIPDGPARREAWNNTVDSYIRDRVLPEAAGNWTHPRWLETYQPRGSRADYATKKKSKTYTVHGHIERTRRGSGGVQEVKEAFWTRTGLSKSTAEKLANEQRAEGGVARVVAENGHATQRHAVKKKLEEKYRGYTYNLRSAYDRGYLDALKGYPKQETGDDYLVGYGEGKRAPYLRR